MIPSLGPAQTQLSFGRVSLSGFSEAAADRKGWGPGKFGWREGGRCPFRAPSCRLHHDGRRARSPDIVKTNRSPCPRKRSLDHTPLVV